MQSSKPSFHLKKWTPAQLSAADKIINGPGKAINGSVPRRELERALRILGDFLLDKLELDARNQRAAQS